MLNIIWVMIIVISTVYGFVSGNGAALGDAFFDGASSCVEFVLKIGSFMMLWQGVLAIADESRLSERISDMLSPVISHIFKGVKPQSKESALIAKNVSANILGLSNAATPMGIEAMRELSRRAKAGIATDNMCLLAIVNSASLQLIPSTLIALRSASGSNAPAEIVVPVWIVSFATLVFAVSMAKLCTGRSYNG